MTPTDYMTLLSCDPQTRPQKDSGIVHHQQLALSLAKSDPYLV